MFKIVIALFLSLILCTSALSLGSIFNSDVLVVNTRTDIAEPVTVNLCRFNLGNVSVICPAVEIVNMFGEEDGIVITNLNLKYDHEADGLYYFTIDENTIDYDLKGDLQYTEDCKYYEEFQLLKCANMELISTFGTVLSTPFLTNLYFYYDTPYFTIKHK